MIAVLLPAMFPQQAKAQSAGDTAALFAEMKQMNEIYNRKLSFSIRITYASEKQPGIIQDSVKGGMEFADSSYHYWLDSVETFANKSYSLTLFKKDKVMYLSKSSLLGPMPDPMQQMRTVLQITGYKRCTVTQQGTIKTLHIDFGPDGAYRQLEMTIDKQTGYVTSMSYLIKTMMLMGKDAAVDADQVNAAYGEYAIVRTTFDHYQLLPADYAGFNESSFFYKDGQEFKPAAAYNDFKIFTGSPNL